MEEVLFICVECSCFTHITKVICILFQSFCMKDLDLFSKFLFYQVLELADWDFNGIYAS